MKIMHLCLSCFYIDGYSYQENLLPKYHQQMGHQVRILASLMSFDATGKRIYLPAACEYVNEDGISVHRLAFCRPTRLGKLFRKYKGTYKEICAFEPDCLFIHGVQFADISVIRKYAKQHPGLKIFIDNHSDNSNSAKNWISRNVQHKIIWRYYAKRIEPFVSKFYGVLPARVDFLKQMYHIAPEKIELLVMGADDELVKKAENPEVRQSIREEFGITQNDFLIVNGGKIDAWKKQTLLLMDAINEMADSRVKLLLFGSVTDELRLEVEKRCSDKVLYIGWVKSETSYDYFAAADLVVFPGRHSVFWEQVAGQGIPMVCKYWEGTTHVNQKDNVKFLYNDSVDEIKHVISELLFTNAYFVMQQNAKIVKKNFLYSDIAYRSIN